MSNFSQLKSMWQSKSKVQSTVPPPKPLPEKIKPPAPKETVSTPVLPVEQPKKIEKQPTPVINSPAVQIQNPRTSVTDIKKNLEALLKLGVNNTRETQYQGQSTYKVEQPKVEPVQPKRDPKDIIPLKGAQRMPTFQQSKSQLEKMFAKKNNEKEGLVTVPPPPSFNLEVIDVKKDQNEQEKFSPEERAQLVMKKIFTSPETPTQPEIPKQAQGMTKSQTFLHKDEEVKTLTLRNQKKQKKSLGDFDDA